MPQITKLSSQKRAGYYNVYVDDAFLCGVSESDLVRLGLRKGQELSSTEIVELQELSNASKHYTAALRFLSYRIRSLREVQQYLQRKGLPPEEIKPLLEQLTREGYINDRDFTERWIVMRRAQQRSMRAIQAELMKKGIDRELLVEVCQADPDEELMQAVALVQKKRQQGKDERLIQQFLARRGFSYSTVSQALQSERDNNQ